MINSKNTTNTIANQLVEPKLPQPQLVVQLLQPQQPNGLVIYGLKLLQPQPE